VGVVPALPLLGPMLEFVEDRFRVDVVLVSEGWSLISPVETSRWSGDAWTGELDLLLAESPPPREEFRGETLPV
jgi:hypothetical protein